MSRDVKSCMADSGARDQRLREVSMLEWIYCIKHCLSIM